MERVRAADYLAFLLRLWREDESTPWRAQVVDPRTGERQAFADLSKLFDFLRDRTEPDGERAQQGKTGRRSPSGRR